MRFMAADVATATGGRLVGQNAHLAGASFDSRTITPGQLFVPIVAERDGHDFIDNALQRGAGAYLSAVEPTSRRTAIVVNDTLQALMALARWGRNRLEAQVGNRVVGITGSVGKTSTKDLTAAALGAQLTVTASEKSFNNDQGLPITILNAADTTQALVLEMGMRGFGEIARLCSIGKPRIGVVTAVAEAHTERVGDIEGVARAKGEMVESLPSDGVAVLNVDDPRVAMMRSRTAGRVLTYGVDESADVRMTACRLDEFAQPTFDVSSPWGAVTVSLAVPGAHMAHNALAALAVAGLCDVDLAAAADAMRRVELSPMRMQRRVTPAGAVVLDDAYNANPASMAAALNTLVAMSATRHVAVLGEMAELANPIGDHAAIAALADSLDIEIVAVGTALYGVEPVTADEAARVLAALGARDAALVKGSRVTALEQVIAAIV
jgi:UDP-N-acetylmuramoyl-tripeptide--D-alanyl-D-alanine ligase